MIPARPASRSAQARRDLPEPAAPRMRTARSPTSTALACTVSPEADILRGGQPYDEARARDAWLAARHRLHSVFGPDASAMSFDDLAGNRKPQSGILPETLGPV